MTASTATSVTTDIEVQAPVDTAFRVFTEQFDRIKPRDHNLLPVPIVETVFEPHVGGHVYDRGADGSECRWARVLVFEPPHRVVISWDISPQWNVETDPSRTSEVEIRFIELDAGRTRVELEHRHLDRHGDGWPGEAAAVASGNGWPLYLGRLQGRLQDAAGG
ncbi:SRPBCC family protein [Nakamurella sp.]|uniref:SRPBCC family protein n=1 Tax=Nakamurella sp. TaxID=1869182 RepID=UPI003B3BD0C7